MRERRDGPRLAAEPLDVLGVGGVLLVQDLQRDLAAEQAVVRPIDARHAAAADELLEPQRSENVADHRGVARPPARLA